MRRDYVVQRELQEIELWGKAAERRVPLEFDLEITARCNNDCRHCFINLPAGDAEARGRELTVAEIERLAGEALDLGTLWCVVTGGEPLLRDDFADVYLALKRRGLLVSVFTNACLVADEHVKLFKEYPPRDIEVSVYGAGEATYERVTRRAGSYGAFVRGLDRLLDAGVQVRLKAMALASNIHEFDEIGRFCRARTKDFYRFDPLLHLRYDGDAVRNDEIRAERLTPEQIVAVETADAERLGALRDGCDRLVGGDFAGHETCSHLFHCGAGCGSFAVGYEGTFRLCPSLWHPDTVYDLRSGTLVEAWRDVVPRVRDMRSESREFLTKCRVCGISNLCLWCPAHAHLESGVLDRWDEYFCAVAKARAALLDPER